jgi:hypothetical protein
LWHYENIVDKERGEGSIELSLDEVKQLARDMGFELSVCALFLTADQRIKLTMCVRG